MNINFTKIKFIKYKSFSNIATTHIELETFIQNNKDTIDVTKNTLDEMYNQLVNISNKVEEHKIIHDQFKSFLFTPSNEAVIDKINNIEMIVQDIHSFLQKNDHSVVVPEMEYSFDSNINPNIISYLRNITPF